MSIETPEPPARQPTSWHGRWSDGQTAAAHPVEIEFQSNALVFRPEDVAGAPLHQWAYASIHSPNPVYADSEHVLLTSTDHPGERLFIDDPVFAKRILQSAPNVTGRSHQWALLKWPLGIAAALVLFWALTFFDFLSPANSLAHILPDRARTTIGTGIIKTIRQDKKICREAAGLKALDKIITRITPAIPEEITPTIEVADINYVNAFAAPGDKIIVSGKLIEQARTPDEIAGVIAHELGHSIERHPEANIIRAVGLLTVLQILTAGEASSFGDLAFMLVQSGYSRKAENEADVHGKKILTSVLIDTRPLAGFFERLISSRKPAIRPTKNKRDGKSTSEDGKETKPNVNEKMTREEMTKENDDDGTSSRSFTSWISTHPPTVDRIAYFNRSKITTNPPIMSDAEFKALKKICGPKKADSKKASSKKPASKQSD